MPSNKESALEQREKCRRLLREEQDLPKVKWACFQEQRRREDTAALRFQLKQEQLRHKLSHPDETVTRFIRKLQKRLKIRMKAHGGTEFSILRFAFNDWDADNSGELSPAEFVGALHSLGIQVPADEAAYIVKYYDEKNTGEMCYQPLVEDVARGCRHFLDHPDKKSARDIDSVRTARPDASKSPFIQAFLTKLRKVLMKTMRARGEYERILIRRAFLSWDADRSGKIDAVELKGAMKMLGLHMSDEEVQRVLEFYDVKGKGEIHYKNLVDDVSDGVPGVFEHPESEGKSVFTVPDQYDKQIAERMFTARPTARSDNKLVEQFKVKITRVLEEKMNRLGGTVESIMREAFLHWDQDSSGKLDVEEFKGAMLRAGLAIPLSEARQIVFYYDRSKQGEIDYNEIVSDIHEYSRGFLMHSSRSKPLVTPRTPALVEGVLTKIAAGVQRCARKSTVSINAKDLMHGTFLRYDPSTSGKLSGEDIELALRKMGIKSRDVSRDDVARLVNWYDADATKQVHYTSLVADTFATVGSARSGRSGGGGGGRGGFGAQLTKSGPAAALPPLSHGPGPNTARKHAMQAEKAKIERRLKLLKKKEGTLGHH